MSAPLLPNTWVTGDCFEVMTAAPEKSIDKHIKHINGPVRVKSVVERGILGVATNDAPWQTQWCGENTKTQISIDPAFQVWKGMLSRCYSKKRQLTQPTYVGCSVDKYWHRYSQFADWWRDNHVEGWQLDKDLLVPWNKVYSPDTCTFVPHWLNSFLLDCGSRKGCFPTGVYFDKKNLKFKAHYHNLLSGKTEHIGRYVTVEEAAKAWAQKKLSLAYKLKQEMDNIDLRIYQTVVYIITNKENHDS